MTGKDAQYDGLSNVSIGYIQTTDAKHKKDLGQFFTKSTVRRQLFDLLPEGDYQDIWEPSAGTGEFLNDLIALFPSAYIRATEIDPTLVNLLRKNFPALSIYQGDALKAVPKGTMDLVIGNPPYFEWSLAALAKKDKEYAHFLTEQFSDICFGRLNIYAAFVKLGIKALKPGGVLAFVIPPSMNNGAFFAKLRQFVIDSCNIVALKILTEDEFVEAQQSVMLLVLRRLKEGETNDGRYVFRRNGITLFSQKPESLDALWEDGKTLVDLGFKVFTGQIVWNQHKPCLAKYPTNKKGGEEKIRHTPLIWSHNIRDGKIDLDSAAVKKKNKWQYVNTHSNRHLPKKEDGECIDCSYLEKKVMKDGPVILVNRVIGSVGKGSIKAAKFSAERFAVENHVNVVQPLNQRAEEMIDSVLEALLRPETTAAAQLITGNSQISATELAKLVPLKISKEANNEKQRTSPNLFYDPVRLSGQKGIQRQVQECRQPEREDAHGHAQAGARLPII